jgi:hypothetical protein
MFAAQHSPDGHPASSPRRSAAGGSEKAELLWCNYRARWPVFAPECTASAMKSPSHRRCEHTEVHAHTTYSGRVPMPENKQHRHQLRCKNAPQATIGKHLLKLCVIG